MSDAGGFTVTVIVAMILLIWSAIDINQPIKPPHWDKAVELCKENGGVGVVHVDVFDMRIDCLNGAKFDINKADLENNE